MKPVCFVLGAGAGIGGNVAKRFTKEGYHAHLTRRTEGDGLKKLISAIEDAGGSATGSLLNAVKENEIEDQVIHVEKNIGPTRRMVSYTIAINLIQTDAVLKFVKLVVGPEFLESFIKICSPIYKRDILTD